MESLLYYYTLKKKLVINEIVTFKNMLFSLTGDLDNAGIATYATQRIHEGSKMWIVILTADKYVLPPCFISSFELFCFGRKKNFNRQSARFWDFVCIMISR